jgi:Xaa-Pro aminopeptidase
MSAAFTAHDLPPMDVASRIRRLREREDFSQLDALLVTRLPNIRYLCGFTGSAAMLLVSRDGVTFVSDGRYAEQAHEQLASAGVEARIAIGTTAARQRELLHDAVPVGARLGLEAHGVTWAQQRTFSTEWFPQAELVPTEGLVEELRRVKEPAEVARIHRACAIADDALHAVAALLADGPTEQEVALRLELAMRERGASGNSFEPIVASGPNGAKPHARPTDRRIGSGELVVLDFGCIVDGYCSDMTRTVSVGDPGPDARHLWDVVLASQRAGRDAVRAGVACADVDRACRSVIEEAGLGERFVHSTGHGVGLEIHEDPRVAGTARGNLAAGHVVTVEPGVYVPGVGGVRIEDTVVVTADGADPLTAFPKELVI